MKRTVLSLAVLGSLVVSAAPYTEGWLTHVPKPADTNYLELSGDYHPKSISVITNRPKLKLAMAKSATAALKSTSAPASLDDFEKLLPTADQTRLKELARGLEYDWVKCFDFVRNHIAFSLYPGIMRGAERTLIDREGNDADQSLLLVALLRLSGYEASVIYEPAQIDSWIRSGFALPIFNYNGESPYNVADWLGIKSSGSAQVIKDTVLSRLSKIGYNYATLNTTSVVIPHYWVALKIGDVTQYLDPSLKPSKATFAHDALTDMGYDRDALIAAAGGTTISGMGVRNLSASGIASHLTSLCTNLRNVWTNANEAAEYFVGGKKIVKRIDDAYFHGKYFSDSPIDLSKQTAEYVNALRTKTVLTCNDSAFYEFYLDEVGLRNLWLTSSGSSTVLHLDDTTLATVSTSSSYYNIELVVDVQHSHPTTHPYYLRRGDDRVYSLVVGFDGDAKNGMRRCATEKLSRIRATGISSTDPLLTAASLFVQGQQWLAQCAMSQNLLNKLTDDSHHRYYSIGIAGQDGGPFVDMANSFSHSSYGNALVGADMFVSSALEHNVVEQLHDVESVSTIKILNLANQQGESVYFVTSQNVDSVVASLSNYSSSFKEKMKTETAEGAVYLLPGNGRTTLNDWTGNGYVMRKGVDGTISTLMAISGGMNGGFASEEVAPDAKTIELRIGNPFKFETKGITYIGQADPVIMPSGRLTDETVDLTLNRAVPLIWSRSYNSSSIVDVGLGRGWSFSFDGKVTLTSDPDSAFAGRQVAAALPVVVAMTVSADLLNVEFVAGTQENIAKNWLVAAMVIKWALDFIPNGTVAFDAGNDFQNFQRCFDGTYVGAPGSTAKCVVSGEGYKLVNRNGAEVRFGTDKKAKEIVDPAGRSIRISRTSEGLLDRVENDFVASFDFCWENGRISRVTDSTGKHVDYRYQNGDLVEVLRDSGNEVWRFSYDAMTHQLIDKIDPLGNCHFVNAYDVFGRVTNQVGIAGGVFDFGYAEELLCWSRNPYGHIVRQICDEDGRTLELQNRYGGISYSAYNGAGRPIRTVSSAGLVTDYVYDGRMNAVEVRSSAGGIVRTGRYWFDDKNRMVAFTNDVGGGLRQEYDEKNRKSKSWDAKGRKTEYVWNDNGTLREERSFDVDGQIVDTRSHEYNEYGLLSRIVRKGVGLPAEGLTETHAYTSAGLRCSIINPKGEEWKYTYDSRGHLLSTEDPGGRVCTSEYDVAGNVIATTDSLNRRTSYVVSPSGKTLCVHYPDGCEVTNVYDSSDNLVWTRDSRGRAVWYEYDAAGGLLSTKTSLGKVSYVRDEAGRTIAVTNIVGNVSTTLFDAYGRIRESDRGDGQGWRTEYDLQDHPVQTIDPDGFCQQNVYSSAGDKICHIRNSGMKEHYEYDFHDQVCRVVNAEGNAFRIVRDSLGRTVAMTNAVGRQVYRAVYDECGNCISETNAKGDHKISEYNFSGLPTRTLADGVESRRFYNDANILVRVERDGAGSIDFGYSIRDRLTNVVLKTRTLNWQIGWSHDKGGLCTNICYGGNRNLTRTYDIEGRLVGMRDWLGNEWCFEYDAIGHLQTRHTPDGLTDTFYRDSIGRLVGWNLGNFSGRELSLSVAGRRRSERVTHGACPTIKQRIKRHSDFNVADQIVRVQVDDDSQGVKYEELYYHDENGSVTNIQYEGISQSSVSFAYRNGTAISAISCGDEKIAVFDTDAGGNRIWFGNKCFIPDYTDNRIRPLVEVDDSGSILRSYIWAGGVLLGIIDEKNGCLITRTDPFGNVVVINKMNGVKVFSALYGPNGEDWGTEGINPTPFGWQGGFGVRKIPSVGLLGDAYLMGSRIYSVSLHRFLSADPTFVAGGLNFYAYANGNPVANNDPSGLCSEPLEVPYWTDENNIWNTGKAPPGGMYHKGDLVVLDNGSVYRVNEDMFALQGVHAKFEGFKLVDYANFYDELMATGRDGYDASAYEQSSMHVNWHVHVNNVCQVTPVVYNTSQVVTAQPQNIVETVLWVKDTADLVSDYEELPSKIIPYQKSTSQKYVVKNVTYSSNDSAITTTHNPSFSSGNQRQQQQSKQGGGPQPTVQTGGLFDGVFTTPSGGANNQDFGFYNAIPNMILRLKKIEEDIKKYMKENQGEIGSLENISEFYKFFGNKW